MKAMILAAGLGSRLSQYTKDKPKALVEVAGKPVLAQIIENLISAGVDDFVINLHYLPDQIREFIDSANYPAKFAFSLEEELLDTGGALKKAEQLLADSDFFILHNCDICTDFNLTDIVETHINSDHDITLAVSKQTSDRHLWFNSEGSFIGCENRGNSFRKIITDSIDGLTPKDYNCITVLNTEILKNTNSLPDKFTLFDLVFAAIEAGALVGCHDIADAYWIDIGTPADLEKANQDLLGSSSRVLNS